MPSALVPQLHVHRRRIVGIWGPFTLGELRRHSGFAPLVLCRAAPIFRYRVLEPLHFNVVFELFEPVSVVEEVAVEHIPDTLDNCCLSGRILLVCVVLSSSACFV